MAWILLEASLGQWESWLIIHLPLEYFERDGGTWNYAPHLISHATGVSVLSIAARLFTLQDCLVQATAVTGKNSGEGDEIRVAS